MSLFYFMRRTGMFSLLFFFSFYFSGFFTGDNALSAQGNLLITPRRVLFEGSKRSEELNLANTGKDTARYNVSLIQYRMKEDGSFVEIFAPDSGQYFADKNLRFFPRNVVLAPNEAQVVRVQLTKTNELTPGEYRSHIYFRAVPTEKPLGEKELGSDTTSVSVKLTPIFGITIPVIIRIGESNAKVMLDDLSFSMIGDTLPQLRIAFKRSGNMSVYGDLTIKYISPEGKSTQVGVVKGIAVYTPNKMRYFLADLEKNPSVNYRKGKLEITYTSQSDNKAVVMAEAGLILN